jgi:hypothetical protein
MLYAEDATLYDPETVATGRDAISGAVDNLLLSLPPDFVFTAIGRAVGHKGTLFWRAGPPDGPVVITGRDVAHIENRRIKLLYVFVDPVARRGTDDSPEPPCSRSLSVHDVAAIDRGAK